MAWVGKTPWYSSLIISSCSPDNIQFKATRKEGEIILNSQIQAKAFNYLYLTSEEPDLYLKHAYITYTPLILLSHFMRILSYILVRNPLFSDLLIISKTQNLLYDHLLSG